MAPYSYKPLDLATKSIRVLQLTWDPSAPGKRRLNLIETVLGDFPYEALSYTWGDVQKTHQILVDNSEMLVTENLHTALEHLVVPGETRFLWIDAICINQGDHQEQGHQVGQMRLVYKNAERVLIWLGLSNDRLDWFFRKMKEPWVDEAKARQERNKSTDFICGEDLTNQVLGGFQELIGRPWFERVWILQEVASARAAIIMCGWNSLSTRLFALVPSLFNTPVPEHCQAVLDIMPGHARKTSWWSKKRDLGTLLIKFSTSKATYEQDKIFALIGICSDTDACDFIIPDYTKNLDQILQETASFLLHRALGFKIQGFPKVTLSEILIIAYDTFTWAFEWASRMGNFDLIDHLLKAKLVGILPGDQDETISRPFYPFDYEDYTTATDLRNTSLHSGVSPARGSMATELEAQKGINTNTQHSRVIYLNSKSIISYGGVTNADTVTKPLADNEIDPNKCRFRTSTPLSLTIRLYHRGIIDDVFLTELLSPHDNTDINKMIDVSALAMFDGGQWLRRLSSYNVLGNKQLYHWATPLWLSVALGTEAIVDMLLQRNADINAIDLGYGVTPLALACYKDDVGIATRLLMSGAQLFAGRNTRSPPGLEIHRSHENTKKLLARNDIISNHNSECLSKLLLDPTQDFPATAARNFVSDLLNSKSELPTYVGNVI